MEYVGIESTKNSYIEVLQENGEHEEALRLEAKDFTTPVFDGIEVHQEEEPSKTLINNELKKLGIDFLALDSQIISKAQEYNDLVNNILTDLDAIDEIITTEEERVQDMNIIIGNFDEFASVRTLKSDDLNGSCSAVDNYTFSTYCEEKVNVPLNIIDVSGNGYEGNEYVYNGSNFEKDSMDTSNREFMIDDSITSFYEYSRLTATNKQDQYPSDVNYDSNEAECVVTLGSETLFNSVRIQSDQENIILKQVQISEDGTVYKDVMDSPIRFNSETDKYNNENYIYGSGIICFPNTNYLKLTFNSDGITNENLAFKKINLNDITLTRDTVFNIKEYVTEYLIPGFGSYYNKTKVIPPIPLSILITMTLLMTKNHPDEIGAFNFWNLDYNKNLVKQKSDKGKCAFYDREEAIIAIMAYLGTEQFEEVFEDMPSSNKMNAEEKNQVLFRILKIMKNNYSVLYSTGLDYIENMKLYSLDRKEVPDIDSKVAQKYEQWFSRKDKQELAYQKMLEEAQTIVSLEDTKRHVIRINDITAFTGNYDSSSYLETGELLLNQTNSIAVFVNEYIPPTFIDNGNYFEYLLIINGVEYNVVPINCHRNGIKVIRYSGFSITEDYTQHIGEPIKSAKLAIKINTPDTSISPYISNIKVCIGKAVTK